MQPSAVPDAQVNDLVAMLECQAYALEDIMKQKKQLSAHVKQATAQKGSTAKKLRQEQEEMRLRSIEHDKEVTQMSNLLEPSEMRRTSKIGAGVRHMHNQNLAGPENSDIAAVQFTD